MPQSADDWPRTAPASAARLWLLLACVWLALAAAVVDVEYYDGLSAIANARYFLGVAPSYIYDRGPLMAWVQMPAEWARDVFGLHPLDPRPNHAVMAVLHALYLVVTYRTLAVQCGRSWATLAAFVTAVTSYVFWSYAPFVSHDLAPGLLLLWMLVWSEEVASSPRWGPWLLLVAAGTAGPLVKQTYGVFWIAVLAAHLIPTVLRTSAASRTSARGLARLVAGAVASAVLAWVTFALVLADWAPQVGFWMRPYRNLQYLAGVYDGTDVRFPAWIYVRNAWAYGRLTTLLVLPGLWLAWRGTRWQQRVAWAWITAVVVIHAMPLREVRYLAFLAPLSACLIAPAVAWVCRWRVGLVAAGVLLAADAVGGLAEATRIRLPFYRDSPLRRLVEPLDGPTSGPRTLYHTVSMLSFVAPGQSPLAADRYHRIFHVGAHHVGILYGYADDDVRPVPPRQFPVVAATAREGDVLLFAPSILAQGPTWRVAPPPGADQFVQGVAVARAEILTRHSEDAYATRDGTLMHAVRRTAEPIDAVALTGSAPFIAADALAPAATLDGAAVVPVTLDDRDRLVFQLPSGKGLPERVVIRWFDVQRRSTARGLTVDSR